MKTAIILEIKDKIAVVMVNGGQFINVKARPEWQKGDVITLQEKTRNVKALYTVAACLAVVFLASLGGYKLYFTEASIISMDINPSLELSINCFDKVISSTSYNKDASKLLAEEDVKGLSYMQAIDALLKSETSQPYLEKNKYLELAVYSKHNTSMAKKVNSKVQSVTKTYPNVQVSCHRADKKTVTSAHRNHMSLSKYLTFLDLQKVAPELKASDYTHCQIGEMKNQIKKHHQKNKHQNKGHSKQDKNHQKNSASESDRHNRKHKYAGDQR